MGKINVLSFAVANLIAAGEVVDRPASVIKELMENSIDAGATSITVELQNGGVTLMRVTDNGCGISPEDLPIAIRRHATSKIKDATDLDSIMTLGFRGEALAAIASVSDLRIFSRTADAPFGAVLEAHGGEQITVREQGCSVGTSVIVENLFSNVPARKKFLKKDLTETLAVAANVEKIALSHPEISFRLVADGTVKLESAGDGTLISAIHSLYGRDFAGKMLEVKGENEGVSIWGYVGRTDNYKGNRNYENFFVNGRFIKSKTALSALEQAYTSYMPPERFPCCVLFIKLNPAKVDVNVHPAKLEVKFSDEKAVFEAVYYAVRSALEQNVTRPEMELGDRKKNFAFPGGKISNATSPLENGKHESVMSRQLSYDWESRMQAQPQQRMSAQTFRQTYGGDQPQPSEIRTPVTEKAQNPAVNSAPVAKKEGNIAPVSEKTPEIRSDLANGIKKEPESVSAPTLGFASDSAPIPENIPKNFYEGLPDNQPLTVDVGKIFETSKEPDPPAEPSAPDLPYYRIVGDVFHSYILVELEDKLLIIDQHAAHERILFEQLKAGMLSSQITSQMLMLPLDVMMTSGEVEILKQYDTELNQIGFSLTYAKNTVSATAIPEGVECSEVAGMLQTMAARLLDNTGSIRLTRDVIFEKALYQGACKAAIKAGREYAPEHLEWVVKKLMEIPDITFCPHGRPVAMELSKKKIDRQFDRTGF